MLRPIKHFYHSFAKIPFVRDVITLQLGQGVYTITTFLGSIALARLLGVEEYGRYAVVLALVSTFKAFTNLGQSTTLQVFFAEEYGKKNNMGMAAVLKNFLQVSVVHILLLLILAFVSRPLAEYLYGDRALGTFASVLFLFHAIDLGNSAVLLILQAIRRIRLKTIMEQIPVIGFTVLTVCSLLLGYGIWGVVLSQLAISIVFLGVSLWVYFRIAHEHMLPTLQEVLRVPMGNTAEYFRQGLWFSADKNIGNLFPSGLFFVLSLVAPVSTVGIARIALQLAQLSKSFLLPQVVDLSTTVLASSTTQGVATVRTYAVQIIKHSLMLHALISICAMIAFPYFIPLVYGHAFEAAIPMTLWLIVASLLGPLAMMNSPILRIFRKIHYSIISALFGMIIMWSCILFLGPMIGPETSFVMAFALGQLLPIALALYIFTCVLGKKHINIHNTLQSLLLLGCSLLITVGLLEWGLRFTGLQRMQSRRPHLHQATHIEGLNYEFVPNLKNQRGYNWERVSTNSLGMRGPEPNPEQPNIVLVGDSFTFGFGVHDHETHAEVLRRRFPEYNVHNLGVNGYNIEQEVRAYEAKFAKSPPALVVLEFYWNDMQSPSILTDEAESEVYDLDGYMKKGNKDENIRTSVSRPDTLRIPFKYLLTKHSALFTFVEKRTKWLPFRKRASTIFVDEISAEDLQFYEHRLARLTRSVGSAEKIFLIWTDPYLHQRSRPALHAMAKKYGWHVLDLYDVFGNQYPSLSWDWHPNAKTHKKVGTLLADMIQVNELLE